MVALNLFLEKVISINYKPDHNDIFLVQAWIKTMQSLMILKTIAFFPKLVVSNNQHEKTNQRRYQSESI